MISHNQEKVLIAIAVIVAFWMVFTKIRHYHDVEHRKAVASIFIGEELAAVYVRLDLGNCNYVRDRRYPVFSGFIKRRSGDVEKCSSVVTNRQEALFLALGENPTPKECFSYVRPKVETSMTDNAVKSACNYFLKYNYG